MSLERIAICGGGNAAHVLMARLAGDHQVAVYAPLDDEVQRLQAGLARRGQVTAEEGDLTYSGKPALVSDCPEAVFAGAELMLLALPASAHGEMLAAAAPYLPPGSWVVALPARGGFDWQATALLPRGVQVAGLQTLPWACRVPPGRYGELVHILGAKAVVDLASRPSQAAPAVAGWLGWILGVTLQPLTSFLALTLANTGQLIHPGIMCGLFGQWDGRPVGEDQAPLFYGGVGEETAALLQAMSDEVQAICRALAALIPGIDLGGVLPLDAWLRRAYAGDIADPTTLRTCFTTNRAYASLRAPMHLVEENALVPWFAGRYLTEDVPFGLLVTRGIAELCRVATPAIDSVITWAQQVLDKEWLVAGALRGVDVASSRAPQCFGIRSAHALAEATPRSAQDLDVATTD